MNFPAASATFAPGAPLLAQGPIRLMVVDDSPIARAVLTRMLAANKDFEVVAQAGNAEEALATLRTVVVDTILLDVEMPGTSGLDALPRILERGAGARVLIVSSLCERGAEANVRALALGATDTLPKPGSGSFAGRFSDVLAERIRRIGRAPVPQRREAVAAPAADRPPLTLRAMPQHRLACLALGASTGGLHALGDFLRALPDKIAAPILITQHLPPVFMPFFARQIEAASGRLARVAEDGMALRAEEILVAPGDAHLRLERAGAVNRVKLCRVPASSGCLPSVDPMLWSIGEIYGRGALGIVFSGMGRDGLFGSARLVESGGAVLVQDQASSAVWGMPRAVAEAGLASAVLPPVELARRVADRIEADRWN